MKKLISLLSGLLIVTIFSSAELKAQENLEKSKQKDQQKKQQQIIEKKKQQKELDSITEKAQATYEDELKKLFEEQKKAQAESKEDNDENVRDILRGDRRVYRVNDVPGVRIYNPSNNYFIGSGDNTTFTISKKLKETYTFSSDFEYEVPENVTGLYFDFGSELETGTLKLTITKPGGKVFQVFSVAPIANVDWNKKFKIKEGESKEFAGTWKITISTKEAKGYYELRINSY